MANFRLSATDWMLLQVIQRLGAAAQRNLAHQTRRRASTINGATQRLLAAGWLKRVGQVDAGRGRPAILLAVNDAVGAFAGIDITSSEIHYAVVAADGRLLEHTSLRLGRDRRPATILNQIDLSLRGLLSRLDYKVDDLLGLWAGVNGAVDDRGVVVACASLGWRDVPLAERLSQHFGCPALVRGAVTVINAAAEALMGVAREARSLLYFHVGRGISARFVENGRALVGHTQRAGELGHVVVAPGGPRCACGNRGCLEAVASGPAIAKAVRRIPRRQLPPPLRTLAAATGSAATPSLVQAVFNHAPQSKNDPVANLAGDVAARLATGAAFAVAAYDPEIVVLGGYVVEDNPRLRKHLQKTLPKLVLDGKSRGLHIVRGEVLTQDRAVGGAAEVCQRFWANPRELVSLE